MDELDYLFATFAAVWAGIFGYVLMLSFRQRKLHRAVDRLEERIKRRTHESG